ncbi:MAG: Na(+)/H(+) antiporter subunit B [Tenuifilum sp.]|uniref:Na(+)/H(+) antiporter subunit B n=1 Tax=Tenuifilum sp. TaxID=2760880 RepID=UPI0030A074A3
MIKKGILLLLLVGFVAVISSLLINFTGSNELNPLARYYAENGPAEVGAANLVTAVVVTYRGFDTLGEVTILFIAAAIVGFFLKVMNADNGRPNKLRKTSEILETASTLLVPTIFMLGVYIFVNGHLTPGGGFQGGAVIATGVMMIILAQPTSRFNHKLISVLESVSGVGFVAMGILGLILASGFLNNAFLPLGKLGSLLSAGAIPIIYVFIGIKVGSELTGILDSLKENQNEI